MNLTNLLFLTTDVPQGSILCLLFLIIDIIDIALSVSCLILLYMMMTLISKLTLNFMKCNYIILNNHRKIVKLLKLIIDEAMIVNSMD